VRVYVGCVGCEQRRIDAQRVVNYFKANGAKIVGSPKDCEHAILITCAVDSSNEQKSLSKLEDIIRELPKGSKMTVGGCLPSISPGSLSDYNVDGTFSPRNIEGLDATFRMAVPMVDIPRPNRSDFDSNIEEANGNGASPREEYETAKKGFKVVIDDGCLLNCAYCIIKKATGRLKSIAPQMILTQVREGLSVGEKTIMLLGGDTGAYGRDINTNLHRLLREITCLPGDFRLFIHDFNVNWLERNSDEYLNIFSSAEGQKIRGISFPIQSGSDRILALMKRPYKAQNAVRILNLVRSKAPHISMGTHVMVGFPSESNDDFALTLKMLESVGFDFITCFPYSEHASANSANIIGKIAPETVEARLSEISSIFGNKVKIMR
jgi:MiaB/RimO family radical SAM methylthiotransferase